MRDNDFVDMFDDMLDDADGQVITVCGLTFTPSQVLKECDPIAYRLAFNEFLDSMLLDLQEDLNRLDSFDDAGEIEDIESRIAELEDSYL